MSVFEDLVEELKEDQLLEETVTGSNEPGFNKAGRVNAGSSRSVTTPKRSLTAQPADKKKFYSDEIAALQVVELVFTGVERELFGSEPQAYDDLAAKQALHKFVHYTGAPQSSEAVELERTLAAEIDNWKKKLLARDAKMSPANLRRHCERTQPPLSSQALFALARFYFSTGLTASSAPKFESILTRLFSKRGDAERREPLMNKEETIGHLKTRFSDWSGVAELHDTPDAMLSIMSFEEFSTEAEKAESFDALAKTDFFKRVVMFKESVRAHLAQPTVMAACIRANISMGNAVAALVGNFGEKAGAARAKKKFGAIGDDVIGRAVGRSIDLEQLFPDEELKLTPVASTARQAETKQRTRPSEPIKKKAATASFSASASGLFGVNKWLLLVSVLAITISIGFYFWSGSSSDAESDPSKVPPVELAGFEYKDNVKIAKINAGTMYAVMTPEWDMYDDNKKRDLAKKLYTFAEKKGVGRLSIMNSGGKTVATGTADNINLQAQ